MRTFKVAVIYVKRTVIKGTAVIYSRLISLCVYWRVLLIKKYVRSFRARSPPRLRGKLPEITVKFS